VSISSQAVAAAGGVVLRPAAPADAGRIAAIQVGAWRRAYAGIFPAALLRDLPPSAWSEDWELRTKASSAEAGLLIEVAEAGGAVIGFCCSGSGELDTGGPGIGELHTLYVDPDHWRRGAGRRLIVSAAAGLRRRGYGAAIAWVVAQHAPARRFYEAMDGRLGATQSETNAGHAFAEVAYVWQLPRSEP
jgi:ribosomal protein S18 acetylase RimI-like enzyme